MLVVALFGLAVALSGIVITYFVPDMDGGTISREDIYAPAIISSVIAGLVSLATAAWVYLVFRRPRPLSRWMPALGLVVVELVVVFAVELAVKPVY